MDATVASEAVKTISSSDPLVLLTGGIGAGKILQVALAKYVMPFVDRFPRVKAAIPTIITTIGGILAAVKGGMPVANAIYGSIITIASAHLIKNSSLATSQASAE